MNMFTTGLLVGLALGARAASPAVVPSSVKFLLATPKQVVVSYGLEGGAAIVTCDMLTNGVSVGAATLAGLSGDVNRLVSEAHGRIVWTPGVEMRDVTAVVTAHPVSAPPDYLCVDLRTGARAYYTCAEGVPGGVTADVYKTDKLLMRRIPAAGTLWRMGAPTAETKAHASGNCPEAARMAALGADYFMGVYALTHRQWRNLSDDAYRAAEPQAVAAGDVLPQDISYNELRGMTCDWPQDGHDVAPTSLLASMRRPAYLGIDFDLPTSAQWEYACRAGTTGVTYDDAAPVTDLAWTSANAGGALHAVGLKKPNPWGLYDMLGNKMEWALDKSERTVPAKDGGVSLDPGGAEAFVKETEGKRILRGGSFFYDAAHNRCAWTHDCAAGTTDAYRGARLCCPASLTFEGN